MFIKLNKSKNRTYVQLVQSYRQDGQTKHEVLFNFGNLEELQQNPSLKNIANKLLELAGVKLAFDLANITQEAEIFNWGYLVYRNLWKKFKLDMVLERIQTKAGKSKFNFNDACFLIVLQHLLAPGSKLNTHEEQEHYVKLPKVDLHHLYRSLDILCDNKELIESHLFNMNRDLFNMQVDVVFYDVTTFHFESTTKDAIKNFGFSKANKINEVQIVLGMLTDCEGRPIGYELFPGNTFEGKTLEVALDAIGKRFGIRNIIIVADRGINNKLNLKQITDKGYGYIVASRIKNLNKEIKNKIFTADDYKILTEENGVVKYKVIDYINKFKHEKQTIKLSEKLVITHSEKRAAKDKKDRERLLEKAEYLLADKSKIKASNKRGGKKYLQAIGDTDWKLDKEALARDEKFDGYYAIQTSEHDLSVEAILDAYHSLWKIEESFRIMKSTLEVRPIFHWTPDRIKGHFVICFLAFLLERTLEFKLRTNQIQASPSNIREAINNMQFAAIEFNEQKLFVKTKGTELGSKILRTLKIQPPRNVMPIADFNH
jgi:transposase